MIDAAAPGSDAPRAFLRIGGMSVAHQQLGIALALQCERIVCVARALTPELVALQHEAERAGAQFQVIPGARPLLGLITAVDEVIALGDGLFASTTESVTLLEKGQGVLVQPIEQGLAAGFERIDLNHASAGAMRIPGRLVERLAELPADCDAISALQRIALQAGITQRPLPPLAGAGSFWTLVRNEAEAHALEPQWIRQRTSDGALLSPGKGVALLGVRNFGPALLHAGSGAGAVMSAAVVTVLLGLGAGWFGLIGLGFSLMALSWIIRQAAGLLVRIETDVKAADKTRFSAGLLYDWALDIALLILAGWGVAALPWQSAWARFFPALMLLALLRIVPRAVGGRWTSWMEDRALLAALLGLAVLGGALDGAVHIGAGLLALAGILLPRRDLRLT